jgi:hypothetical protein
MEAPICTRLYEHTAIGLVCLVIPTWRSTGSPSVRSQRCWPHTESGSIPRARRWRTSQATSRATARSTTARSPVTVRSGPPVSLPNSCEVVGMQITLLGRFEVVINGRGEVGLERGTGVPTGRFPEAPSRTGVPSRGTGLCTGFARWSASCGCWYRRPWGRDVAAAVAVAVDRYAGCAGEHATVVGELPSDVAEAAAEFGMVSRWRPPYLRRIQRMSRFHAWWSTALKVALDTPCRK